MAAEILYLNGNLTPIGQYIRVGYSGHRQLENLHGTGRIHLPHVVIDAAQFDVQIDLINTLRESGTEIVLDTNVAELSSIGKFDGAVRKAPWANNRRPLAPSDFAARKKREIVKKIAEFSILHNVDAVLAPTHLISGSRDEWMSVDISSCEFLREELDNLGGKSIAIDYPLIIPSSALRDAAHRRVLVNELANLPIENIWMRISGFGADASPVGIRRYISNIADFHGLRKPIIADCVGGLSALAIAAFGSVGGICHGVAERERFDTNSWIKRPQKGGGGQYGRIYLPALDRHFKIKDAELIMKAKGGLRLLSCQDRDCCALGFEDTTKHPKTHFLIQRKKQLQDLERTHPDRRRARFLDHHLIDADRKARQAAKLKIDDNSIVNALQKTTNRLDRMRGVLEDLDETIGSDSTKSEALKIRLRVQTRIKTQRR